MTVLIDSWAWVEYWKGGKDARKAAEQIEGTEEAVVSSLNVAEVYFWVSKHYGEEMASRKICHLDQKVPYRRPRRRLGHLGGEAQGGP